MILAPPPRAIHRPSILLASASAVVVLLLACGCNRTIEEDEPRVLVDSRIEPCRQFCTAMQSPDCGRTDEGPFRSADECAEDCAADDPENGWGWAPQEDGTDACATDWVAAAACMDSLTCEEQHGYFRRPAAPLAADWPCKPQYEAKWDCERAHRGTSDG